MVRVLLFALLALGFSSCQTARVETPVANTESIDRGPDAVDLPPPPWILEGLGKESYRIYSAPARSCLQTFINANAGGGKPNPNLAKWILAGAKSAKLDPYVFAALIQQETGDFISKTGVNGVGLTQMTGNTVDDACLALEASDCKTPFANPKYVESWETVYENEVASLYGSSDFRAYYPWRKACSNYVSQCDRSCGISDPCMLNIRKLIHADSRMSILLGTFTLVNKLAEARNDNPKADLKTLYRVGLRLYNGHPKYKVLYSTKIMNERVPKLLKACPPL